MGPRRLIVLLLAVVAAGGTAMYARSWMERQRSDITVVAAPTPADEEIHQVLVADVDLAAGMFVKPQHIAWQRWPTDDVPDSYLLEGLRSQDEMIGAVVRRAIAAGTPVTDGAVVKPGERGFLAAVLEPGMRAMSVPINLTSANSGLIFPGDRVDLILTQTLVSAENKDLVRRVSETVLEDVRIIAMGSDTRDDPREGEANAKAKTATFEVTPAEAETIALLTELGKLSLSLRSLASEVAEDRPPRTENRTWDHEVSEVLQTGRLSSRLMVLRGSDSENVQVQQGSN